MDLTHNDLSDMIKHHLNVCLVLVQSMPQSDLRADWIADVLDCRNALPLLINPPNEEEQKEEEEEEEDVMVATCPQVRKSNRPHTDVDPRLLNLFQLSAWPGRTFRISPNSASLICADGEVVVQVENNTVTPEHQDRWQDFAREQQLVVLSQLVAHSPVKPEPQKSEFMVWLNGKCTYHGPNFTAATEIYRQCEAAGDHVMMTNEKGITMSESNKPAPTTTPQPTPVPPQKSDGPVRIDGFLVPAIIPDDKRLNILGIPVLIAYCKRWGLTPYSDKAAVIAVLKRKRDHESQFGDHLADRQAEPPTATPGKVAVAATAKALRPIDLTGWGKEAISQYMNRTWTVPLMVEFCRAAGFILPPTLADFIKAMTAEARRCGWSPEGRPEPTEARPVVGHSPTVKPAPRPAPAPAPKTDDLDVRKRQITELISKPSLSNLSKACHLAGLESVDRTGTKAMKEALEEWLKGETVKPTIAPAPKKTSSTRITDNPLTPRPHQVRVLKALAKHGALTKKQVAELSPVNEVDINYWVGSTDEAVMDKGESYRGMKCLVRLGMVIIRQEVMTSDKTGGLKETLVYELTDAGVQWLDQNPNA